MMYAMAAWSDKPLEDREFPDEIDTDDDGDLSGEMHPCPYCKLPVWEQAPQCPHCANWLIEERTSWRSSRKLYVRFGLWASKTILWNWLFWLALAIIGAMVALGSYFRVFLNS